jgi:glutathione synthase/RimK-type ligase-like ATP-grasp enzyme
VNKIGVLFGREDTFPYTLIHKINEMGVEGVSAEPVQVGGVKMAEPSGYRVIIDRISQDVPFYRAFLKNAVLTGTTVINNPFWWTADDKFFNYALASKLGVAIPRTVVLPHNTHPPDITAKSLRNLLFPLNWEEIFAYIGFPAFLKPYSGGGWKHVYKIQSPDELFHYYNQTGDLCMTLQAAVEFDDYYRCYVVGQQKVHIMRYDPKRPHAERYVKDGPPIDPAMHERLTKDCLTICQALGYDMNTVEFAVQDGVPYAIDFLNPAPDADYHSVGEENFFWFINAIAELAIAKAQEPPNPPQEYRWSKFLSG